MGQSKKLENEGGRDTWTLDHQERAFVGQLTQLLRLAHL